MRKVLIFSACLLLVANTTWAAKIKSHTNMKLVVKLNSGKVLELLPQATADISDRELTTPQLQTLISAGQVTVIQNAVVKKPAAYEKTPSFPTVKDKKL
jgi:hypothetical protein